MINPKTNIYCMRGGHRSRIAKSWLKKEGIDFELAVIGEQFKECPQIFNDAKLKLSDCIIQFGVHNP